MNGGGEERRLRFTVKEGTTATVNKPVELERLRRRAAAS